MHASNLPLNGRNEALDSIESAALPNSSKCRRTNLRDRIFLFFAFNRVISRIFNSCKSYGYAKCGIASETAADFAERENIMKKITEVDDETSEKLRETARLLCSLYRETHPDRLVSDFELAHLFHSCKEPHEAICLASEPYIRVESRLMTAVVAVHGAHIEMCGWLFRHEDLCVGLVLAVGASVGYVECRKMKDEEKYSWCSTEKLRMFEEKLKTREVDQDPWVTELSAVSRQIAAAITPKWRDQPVSVSNWLRDQPVSVSNWLMSTQRT
jgi:hypothetical protein